MPIMTLQRFIRRLVLVAVVTLVGLVIAAITGEFGWALYSALKHLFFYEVLRSW